MDRSGEWPLIPMGFAMATVGLFLLAAWAPALSAIAVFFAALVAYSGFGLIFSPAQTSGLRTLPPHMNPHGVALNSTFIQVAACIGPALYTGIMQSAQAGSMASGATSALALANGFRMAMVVAASMGVVGIGVATAHSLAAKRRQTAQARDQQAKPAAETLLGSIMDWDYYALAPEASTLEAMRTLSERHVSGMPLVDKHGHVRGFVSDGDIMRYLADAHPAITSAYSLVELANRDTIDERLHNLVSHSVEEIATKQVVCLPVGASLEEAFNTLADHKLKKVPVVQDGRIVGMLSRSNVIRHLMESLVAAETHAMRH